jgi:hypothetical protein
MRESASNKFPHPLERVRSGLDFYTSSTGLCLTTSEGLAKKRYHSLRDTTLAWGLLSLSVTFLPVTGK